MKRSAGRLTIAANTDEGNVEDVYIAISDHDGGEGIYTIIGPSGEKLPLVAVDDKGLEILRQFSQEAAEESGKSVSIIRFTGRSHYETFRPLATGE